MVAPLVGAWVEMERSSRVTIELSVAPLVGAWVEMEISRTKRPLSWSLPLWERGLKLVLNPMNTFVVCRSPCGSVG